MALSRLSVDGFRNLHPQRLAVSPGLTAVVGPNGAGKSNILEAVAVLGTLASFRTPSLQPLIQHGAGHFALGGQVSRDAASFDIAVEVRGGTRLTRTLRRASRILTPADYLGLLPVVALSSADRELVVGAPDGRRRFLDRLAFHLRPDSFATLQRYRHNLRQRNALLARSAADRELDAFEGELARLAARVRSTRLVALAALERTLPEELSSLGWSLSRPVLGYHTGEGIHGGEPDAEARLRAALARYRVRERARGHTLVGPHRDDLVLSVGGMPAREVLSAGQGKLLATALKLAAMAVMAAVRGAAPTVVFDDVDAELDAAVLDRVVGRLAGGAQTLVSSAHEEMLLPRLRGATVWRVAAGQVHRPAEGEIT